MMNANKAELARVLHREGYRLTQPRSAVLQVLQENKKGLTPEEVYQLGKANCASLGLVTVYRTLDLLTDLGLARRVHSEQHCHKYSSAGSDQHHLVCQACHRLTEFPCEGLCSLIERVRRQTGFTISGHLLELSGLCPECQAEQADGKTAPELSTCGPVN